VAVSIVLVAVVVIGLSGQPNRGLSPNAPPSPPAIAAASPSGQLSSASPAAPATIAPAPTPVPPDRYGIALAIGKLRYVTSMTELSPGHLTAELHFPSPPAFPQGTLEFRELWRDDLVDAAELIGQWTVDLDRLAEATASPATLIQLAQGARPEAVESPLPVATGYQITVDGMNDLLFSVLSIDIQIGEPNRPAERSQQLGVSVIVDGDERAAMTPGTNGSFKATLVLPTPRRPMDTMLLLYDVNQNQDVAIWTAIDQVPLRLAPRQADVGVSRLVVNQEVPGFKVVARTSGHVGGESIYLTVIVRPISGR
jgi:hypothetical protein